MTGLQVYYGMNLLQQFIIRRIGASLFAMGTALRLVASIAGDSILACMQPGPCDPCRASIPCRIVLGTLCAPDQCGGRCPPRWVPIQADGRR